MNKHPLKATYCYTENIEAYEGALRFLDQKLKDQLDSQNIKVNNENKNGNIISRNNFD